MIEMPGGRSRPWLTVFSLVVVGVASVMAAWPLFSVHFPAGHDATSHVLRVAELERSFRQGVLYPRWTPGLLFGYGYALFSFFAPLVYYVAEIFRLAGSSILTSLQATLALGMLISGLAMFCFVQDVFGRRAAVLSSVAYVFLPYALFDTYIRMAIPESFAFSFLPLILWAIHRSVDGRSPFAPVWGALPLAALVLTHNPSAMLFVPLSAAYALCLSIWRWLEDGGDRHCLVVVGGRLLALYVLGLGLSAFLWLPAMLEQKFTLMGTFTQGDRQFFNLQYSLGDLVQPQLFYRYEPDSTLLVHLSPVQALAAIASTAFAWWYRPHLRRQIVALLLITIIPLVLMTRFTAPLWEMVPTATQMSFPYRLLMFVGLGTAILTGLIATPRRGGHWQAILVPILALLIAASALKNLSAQPLDLTDHSLSRAALARFEAQTALPGTTTPAQILPIWVQVPASAMPQPEPRTTATVPGDSPFQSVQLEEMSGWYLRARVSAREAGRLLAHVTYFPGWQGTVDGAPAPVTPNGPLGLAGVDVPAGEHTVEIRFGDTLARQIGSLISVFAALSVAAVAVWRFRAGQHPQDALVFHHGRNKVCHPESFLEGLRVTIYHLSADRALAHARAHVPSLLLFVFGVSPVVAFFMGASRPTSAAIAPLRLDAGHGQEIIAWQPPVGRVDESGLLEFSLYWHVRQKPAIDLIERVRLVAENGRPIAELSTNPDLGTSPTTRWLAGEILEDRQDVPWPAEAPAGRYRVEVALVEPGHPDSSPTYVQVGEVFVSRVPPATELPAALQAVAPAIFGGSVALRGALVDGAPWNPGRRLKPGERLDVQIFWQALAPVSEDYSVFLHLSDRKGKNLAQTDSYPPVDLRFTSLWRPGAMVRHHYWLTVPDDAATGIYEIATGLYRRSDLTRLALDNGHGDDRVVLARPRVDGGEALAAPQQRIDARFASGASLAGWSTDQKAGSSGLVAHRGETIPLTLRWRADARIEKDYTVFVHVVDGEGHPVAQVDRVPLDGRVPMRDWQAGDQFDDRYGINLPANLPAGGYQLLVGIYSLPGVQRSPASYEGTSDDKVVLSLIKVVD